MSLVVPRAVDASVRTEISLAVPESAVLVTKVRLGSSAVSDVSMAAVAG